MKEWERRLDRIEKQIAQFRDDMRSQVEPNEDEETRAGREMYEHLRILLNRIDGHQSRAWRCWQKELTDEGKTAWSEHAKA